MMQNRKAEALEVLALMAKDGDIEDPVVVTQYKQIDETVEYEKQNKASQNWLDAFRTKSNRKRMVLACSCAVFGNMSGSGIIS